MTHMSKRGYENAIVVRSHHSNHFISLLDDLTYFKTTNGWWFAYKIKLGAVFLCADPVTSDGPSFGLEDLQSSVASFATAWTEFAHEVEGRPIVLAGMSHDMCRLAREVRGMRVQKIGEEPWLTLGNYEPRGNSAKGVRAGRNYAQKLGCQVHEIDLSRAPQSVEHRVLHAQVEDVVNAWKASSFMHADGLFMRTDPFALLPGRRTFVCKRDGRVEVVLIATPIVMGRSYYIEDVITSTHMTNGAVELSVLSAIKALEHSSVQEISLGVVALRGTRLFCVERNQGIDPTWVDQFIHRCVNLVYNMNGIELFRRRFRPSRWDAVYLATYAPKQKLIPYIVMFIYYLFGFILALQPKHRPKSKRQYLDKSIAEYVSAACLVAMMIPSTAKGAADYHLIGLFNTFVPGGGELLLGNYGEAAVQASVEVSTFQYGYWQSRRQPMTLDGVPEDIPMYKKAKRRRRRSTADYQLVDIRKTLWADWAQEIGIKYHMLNVFDAYREAAALQGVTNGIDQSSKRDLFLAPFAFSTWTDPIAVGIIIAAAGVIYYDYRDAISQPRQVTRAFTRESNQLYETTYIGLFPAGSAAPEEAFYRGYLQNEFYALVPSPFFSIPMTSLAFGLSHVPEARLEAFLGGLLFGSLTHFSDNRLQRAIAAHYWVDLFGGIESYLIYMRNQYRIKPPRPSAKTVTLAFSRIEIPVFDFCLAI